MEVTFFFLAFGWTPPLLPLVWGPCPATPLAQNVELPADLATSPRAISLKAPWKTLLRLSCAATTECDGLMAPLHTYIA